MNSRAVWAGGWNGAVTESEREARIDECGERLRLRDRLGPG